jgi:hypothetical protein
VPDPAGHITWPENPLGHVRLPPLSLHKLAAPCRPGPADTIREPAIVKGFAIVTAVLGAQAPPADTMFPALLNSAQSPGLKLPPPNHKLAPRRVQVLVAVQPYRLCPGAAAVLKNVAPTEQAEGSTVPV